jgi:predicted amidophosphoribosyltransferase
VVQGRATVVVDDVMTSGSTMDEMARVLLAAGAASVHALVVARTP